MKTSCGYTFVLFQTIFFSFALLHCGGVVSSDSPTQADEDADVPEQCIPPSEDAALPPLDAGSEAVIPDANTPHVKKEKCNSLDDDGDGLVDEDFGCIFDTVEACPLSCGSFGKRQCMDGCVWSECQNPGETCYNGVDDDCDGLIDCDDPQCDNMPPCNHPPDAGVDVINPDPCNGLDDDHNGLIDEGYDCVLDVVEACPLSCGSFGKRQCMDGCVWSECQNPGETCYNGVDDDCDGLVDCEDPQCDNMPQCNQVQDAGADGFGPEVCNGLDDDHNGVVDDGFDCIFNKYGVCTTSCGTLGNRKCLPGCVWGACENPAELCYNQQDDDCDGLVDCNDPDCDAIYPCNQ